MFDNVSDTLLRRVSLFFCPLTLLTINQPISQLSGKHISMIELSHKHEYRRIT